MVAISVAHTPDVWRDGNWVKNTLAMQLQKGRLSLVLGAGVSAGLGLPSWVELVTQMYAKHTKVPDTRHSIEQQAEELLMTQYANNRKKFAESIREILYAKLYVDPGVTESQLLSALGALVMASSRGKVSNVVTFNFDDLLEGYLESRGFAVRSINMLPCWNDYGDVTVLHPHGLLPVDKSKAVDRGVIFTTEDFANIIGKEADLWRQKVTDIFRSNTCIFLGLSGKDQNLTNMLQVAKSEHCSNGDAFWGVRLSNANDPMKNFWETRGVCNFELPSYDSIPAWLLDICKLAAQMRK